MVFQLIEFTLKALESARKCTDFQLRMNFEKVIIPAKYFNQMDPDFIKKQDNYTVHPFLKALEEKKVKKKIFLTLPMTSHMVTNKTYRTYLLNWITSYPEISGVYLFAEKDKDNNEKQISSEEFILLLF